MKTQPQILLVEDDRGIATLVEKALRHNGFDVTQAADGRSMDHVLRDFKPDLMLLDLMLPGEDGLSIARRLKADDAFPIIMLTAMGEETDRVVGLEIGADDYVVKPFSSRELVARIRAVLRRTASGQTPQKIESRNYHFLGWTLGALRRELIDAAGVRIELTSAEFQLLQIFCENANRILNREALLRLAQNKSSHADDRSIDTLVSRIRRKIEANPKEPELLKTVRLGGYLFTPEVTVQ